MIKQKGLLLVISGPSGCGKGTVMKELLSTSENLFLSVSAATRAPRPGEENGVHYYFMTKEQFQEKLDAGEILEYTCYCGNYYGTPKQPVIDHCENGEDVILEIEVEGAGNVCRQYPDAVSIFIMPPSMEELESRLINRQTEDMETVRRRLDTAREEMKLAKNYQYVVVNDTVEQAVEKIRAIIQAEKCRSQRMDSFLTTMSQG